MPGVSSYKFGQFELDLRSYELKRDGQPLRLEKMPMELLIFLVEHHGQLVTRIQIIERLWGKQVFLDTEQGVNTAIRKIRQVLLDDPEKPLFLETVVGKGYRFVSNVTAKGNESPPSREELPPPHGPDMTRKRTKDIWLIGAVSDSSSVSSGPTPSPFLQSRLTHIFLALAILTISAAAIRLSQRTPKLTDKDRIVLADFNNTTGDPVFDGTLRQGLAAELEQSPFLSLMSDRQIRQTLQMMRLPPDSKLTPSLSQEICQRINSAVVIEGSIAQIGAEYSLVLRAEACLNGESIASTNAEAQDKTHVLEALGRASHEMRKKLGESLATVERFNTPIEQATTSSLEALRAYDLGSQSGGRGDFVGAIPWFQQAVSLDPTFAMAYCLLGMMQQNLGQEPSIRTLKQAYDLRSTVTERERLFIEFEYYQATEGGDLENAQRVGALWAQTYPRDCAPRGELGFLYQAIEQNDWAVKAFREAHRLCPDDSLINYGLIRTYNHLDRLGEALSVADNALVKNSDSLAVREAVYELAFLRKDTAAMQEQVAYSSGKPGLEGRLLFSEGNSAAYFGRLKKSRELSQQAIASAQSAKEYERAAAGAAEAAEREALLGNKNNARQQLLAALRMPGAAEGTAFLAPLVFAELGDFAAMEPLADKYRKANPHEPYVQSIQLPALTAWIALSRNEPEKAIATLQPTPYESRFLVSPNAYQRGLAYLANHHGKEAAAEFQNILDHPGSVVNSPIGALAHLQLGRAYALQEDIGKARAAYQDFLTLWKDADPDTPILEQAKAESAKLQ